MNKCIFVLLKSPVVVTGHSLHHIHFSPRNATYWPVPVVSDPHVKVSGIKVLEILVKWHKVLEKWGGHSERGAWSRVSEMERARSMSVELHAAHSLRSLARKEFNLQKKNLCF